MTLPIDIYVVRHGESEGNVARRASRHGDDSAYTEAFRRRPGSRWRLTPRGIEQAQLAGAWLRENHPLPFQRCFVSLFLRAKETAGHLGINDAEWRANPFLHERDWGELNSCPASERRKLFQQLLEARPHDTLVWRPPNGESLLQVAHRVDRVLEALHRECEDSALLVCHGEVMWVLRFLVERMGYERWEELELSQRDEDRIHNCQILHYTRRDPVSGRMAPYPCWLRSVCPWDTALSRNVWEFIERRKFSNEDLLREVERTPCLVDSGPIGQQLDSGAASTDDML